MKDVERTKSNIGYMIRYDDKFGTEPIEDIMVNAIPIEDLDNTLLIFVANGSEALDYLRQSITNEFVENIGSSVMVFSKDCVDKIILLDINNKEEIHLIKEEVSQDEIEKLKMEMNNLRKKVRQLESKIEEKSFEDILNEE